MANRYRWDGDDTDDLDKEALEAALRDGAPSWETKPASGSRDDEGPRNTTLPVGPPLPPPIVESAPQPTAPAWTPPTAQVFQGFRPRHAMEGFDFNREQNTGKSAKDAFAYLANQAPPPPLNDKAALGAWFTQYIQPGMNALGHTVTEVNGDTFKFKNWQGEFTVDYGRGAGAPGGALAWQVQDDAQLAPNATYTPQPTGGGVTTQTTTPPAGPRLVDPLAPITDTPNIEELMAEIDALVNGRPLPSDARALAALLRGEP